MTDFNKIFKKLVKYLCICIPILLIISILLVSLFSVPVWLNVLVNVILAIGLCLIFELISVKMEKRKAQKELNSPKKKDPFAD